ncbi:MAG: hypothetical protein FJ038_12885 [Chloroflexi bacterium]|nr:hypothetical protein [Chloroflexota bacterium]
MERFGHLGDSGLDLTAPRWREDPDLIVRMILDTPPSPPRSSLAWGDVRGSFSILQRPLMRRIFRRAATYRRLREQVGSDMIFGYGLLRPAFLELGARLAARGLLARAEDAFLLTLDELRALVAPGAARVDELLATRRAELAEAPDLDLPELIVGEEYVPRRRSVGPVEVLHGTPTSRGTYRGAVRVIRSGADFDRLEPGEVLVVPYSDVAWTPLFARAGAVVAESGGMLSHSSIVARAYGIPCVVSVAQRRPASGPGDAPSDGTPGRNGRPRLSDGRQSPSSRAAPWPPAQPGSIPATADGGRH